MKKDPESRAKTTSVAINQVKKYLSDFTISELLESLKNAHCPYYQQVPTLLIQQGIITKIGKTYYFPNSEPVHFKRIESGMAKIAHTTITCSKKHRNEKTIVSTPQIVEKLINLTDEQLINLLKVRGYKIMKPVTTFEEC